MTEREKNIKKNVTKSGAAAAVQSGSVTQQCTGSAAASLASA